MKVSAPNFVVGFLQAQWRLGNKFWRCVKKCDSPLFSICVSVYGGSDNSELIIASYPQTGCKAYTHILLRYMYILDHRLVSKQT